MQRNDPVVAVEVVAVTTVVVTTAMNMAAAATRDVAVNTKVDIITVITSTKTAAITTDITTDLCTSGERIAAADITSTIAVVIIAVDTTAATTKTMDVATITTTTVIVETIVDINQAADVDAAVVTAVPGMEVTAVPDMEVTAAVDTAAVGMEDMVVDTAAPASLLDITATTWLVRMGKQNQKDTVFLCMDSQRTSTPAVTQLLVQ